jgi:hypothetical protein
MLVSDLQFPGGTLKRPQHSPAASVSALAALAISHTVSSVEPLDIRIPVVTRSFQFYRRILDSSNSPGITVLQDGHRSRVVIPGTFHLAGQREKRNEVVITTSATNPGFSIKQGSSPLPATDLMSSTHHAHAYLRTSPPAVKKLPAKGFRLALSKNTGSNKTALKGSKSKKNKLEKVEGKQKKEEEEADEGRGAERDDMGTSFLQYW